VTSDLVIRHAGRTRHCPGQVRRSRSQVKVQGHRSKTSASQQLL